MAELTLQRLTDRMARYMGWDSTDWPAEILPSAIANECGRDLFNAVEWNFLVGASTDLSLTLGQSYIELPPDFGTTDETALISKTFGNYSLRLVTMTQVNQELQISTAPGAGAYVGAIVFADPDGVAVMPRARIQLAPTPTQSLANVFTLSYHRQWADVTDPGDTCLIPAFLEPLYIRAACLWLAGYEADDEGTLEQRMLALQGSTMWANAISKDANTQQGIGFVENTAAMQVQDMYVPPGMPIGRTQTFV